MVARMSFPNRALLGNERFFFSGAAATTACVSSLATVTAFASFLSGLAAAADCDWLPAGRFAGVAGPFASSFFAASLPSFFGAAAVVVGLSPELVALTAAGAAMLSCAD